MSAMCTMACAARVDPAPRSLPIPDAESPRQDEPEQRVLVIEDDLDIAQLIKLHLEDLPAQVKIAADGATGLEEALSGMYDLIVLDLRLPRMNGLDVCRRLRMQGVWVPVLIVTARTSDSERVVGLELGADDYLGKPFNIVELVARARALVRRASIRAAHAAPRKTLRLINLRIDPVSRRVHVDDREIALTPKEFDLLYILAKDRGRVFTKAELLETLWRLPYEGYEHSVTCHINRLRTKIESDPRDPRYILTVWGVGYKSAD